MTRHEELALIDRFIAVHGVTHCPTVYLCRCLGMFDDNPGYRALMAERAARRRRINELTRDRLGRTLPGAFAALRALFKCEVGA